MSVVYGSAASGISCSGATLSPHRLSEVSLEMGMVLILAGNADMFVGKSEILWSELSSRSINRLGERPGKNSEDGQEESSGVAGGRAGGSRSSANLRCFRRLAQRRYGRDSRQRATSVDPCKT